MATKSKQTVAAATSMMVGNEPRRVRLGRYRSFRVQRKRIAPAYEDRNGLAGGWTLFKRAVGILWRHKRIFGFILLIYGVLNVILAGGFIDAKTLTNAKTSVLAVLGGGIGQVASAVTLVSVLATSGGSSSLSDAASAYQLVALVLVSLMIIRGLRDAYAGHHASLRTTVYNSPAPLIPVLLVTGVLFLELIPFAAGGSLFSTMIGNGIAVTWLEQVLALSLFVLLTLVTVYWWCSTLFAIYIVTLPNMSPIKAIRSANELVRYRRGMILWRLLILVLIIVLVGLFILAPVAIQFPNAASPVFFVLLTLMIALAHSYLYALYRELIV